MNSINIRKTYEAPPVCEKELLRYAGCKTADENVTALLRSCLSEGRDKLTYTVVYRELPLRIADDRCDFGAFSCCSAQLAANLKDCERVVLFAATIGVGVDRLIAKYARIAPSRAVMLQAIGAERIEALCDAFCDDLARETSLHTRPRFSPGYGDLSLETQKDIVTVLDCSRKIGLTLNDSLLMSPSKSVTAFVGLSREKRRRPKSKCALCEKQDCAFRGVL